MPSRRHSPDYRRANDRDDEYAWQDAWPRSEQPPRSPGSYSVPASGRRVYRANGRSAGEERSAGGHTRVGAGPRRQGTRSRLLAVIVLVLVAVAIVLAGAAARSPVFDGSQGTTGTFELLPITTPTS
jgi:hypothetical protein